MTVRVRGIAQIVVFVEEPREVARCQVRDPSGTVWGLDGP